MTVEWAWAKSGPAHIDMRRVHALRDAIDEALETEQGPAVALLQALLRQPTVSGATDEVGESAYRRAMDACLADVGREVRALGMDWRVYEGLAACGHWTGKRRVGASHIGIAGHLDVVPALGDWKHPPFGGEMHDGAVWGRGTQDDKGPVAAVLAAIRILQGLGLEPEGELSILLGTLEETEDWPDMDLLLRHEPMPDFTLVPDGAFPIVIGEKGILTVRFRFSWTQARPQGVLRFLGIEAGQRPNVVPDHAVVTFACPQGTTAAMEALARVQGVASVLPCDPLPTAEGQPCLEVCFDGVAAHGAFPHHGKNAALQALRAVHELLGDEGAGACAGFLLAQCGDHEGAGMGIARIDEKMGDTSLNLGVVTAGPTRGEALLNIRFPLGLTVPEVLQVCQKAAAAAPHGLSVQTSSWGRPQDPIFASPEDHPHLLHTLQAAYHAGTGREPRLASIPGTTYAKSFPLAVVFGPQDPSAGEAVLAHQANEHVRLDRFRENIRTYALAIALLACDHDSFPPPAPRSGRGDGQAPD